MIIEDKKTVIENTQESKTRCSPEIITTLLISYTPTQNVFGLKKIKIKKNKQALMNAQGNITTPLKNRLLQCYLNCSRP